MDYKEAFEVLQESLEFKSWRKNNPKPYLAHFFTELDAHLRNLNWEIGYYDAEKDLITTFAINEQIQLQPEAQVFKERHSVKELKMEEIKTDTLQILENVKRFQMKNYPAQTPLKGFLIIQNIDFGAVWNVTLVTQAFAALNIKLRAQSGEIVHHNLSTFFDFRLKE